MGYVKFGMKAAKQTVLDRASSETRVSTHLWKSREGRILFDIVMPAGEAHLKSRSVVVPDRWYHIAITKSDQEVVLYLNGVVESRQNLLSGAADVPGPGQSPLFLGATHEGKELFKGKLDEVLLYNRVLTGAEVQGFIFLSRESGACRI